MTPNPNENKAEKHSAWSFEEAQLDKIKDTPLGRHVISLRAELSTLRKELEAAKKALSDQLAWVERHLQTLYPRQNKTGYLGSQQPEGYSVAEIPDWEMRQKLEELRELLNNGKDGK